MEMYILGEDNPSGTARWVRLPVEEDKLPASATIACLVSVDGDGYFEGISETADRSRIPELNRLARALKALSEEERYKLGALLECQDNVNLSTVERMMRLLPTTKLLIGVTDFADVGRYHLEHTMHIFLPSEIAEYFDYQEYGRAVHKKSLDKFTSVGYLMCDI